MSKNDFLDGLKKILNNAGVPNPDGMIEYYDEMICDRMEDGMTEEEAVGSLPDPDKIVEDAMLEMPIHKLASSKVKRTHEEAKKSGHGALWVLLLILGFPLWFPILLTAVILVFTFLLVLFIILGTFYIVNVAFGLSGIAAVIASFSIFLGFITFPSFFVGLGGGLLLLALCLALWKPLLLLTKGACNLVKGMFLGIKKMFI